jgi:ferrous iron transport protein B
MGMADLTIALAGNPNAGKSTIFNALTGLHQHTGNWPGKTVEKKEGEIKHDSLTINIVDLPGTYSLTAYSPEEIIARDFIIEERPDVVINVVDATNLERNLYLTVQLLELDVPVVLALNMADALKQDGARINIDNLSQLLGNIPVVQTAANQGKGISELINKAVHAARKLEAL